MATTPTPYRLPYGAFTPTDPATTFPKRRQPYAPAAPAAPQTAPQTQPSVTQAPPQTGGGGITSFVPQAVQQQAQGVNTSLPPSGYAAQAAPQAVSTPPPYSTTNFGDRDPLPQKPDAGASPEYQVNYGRVLAGPLADILAPEGGQAVTRGDIPLIEAGLNFENIQLAEADRQRGYEQLARARGDIGQSPEMQTALQLAMRRAGGDTPFGQDFVDRQTGALKDRSAMARQEAIRGLEQDYARRGIGGVDPALARAALDQNLLGQLSGQIGELERDAATQREASERGSFQDLFGAASEGEGRRAALDQALADVYLETERGPIDLSGLLQPLPSKVAALPITGSKKIETSKSRIASLEPGVTTRPEWMNHNEWRVYWNNQRPKGSTDAEWRAQLREKGILDEKNQWIDAKTR